MMSYFFCMRYARLWHPGSQVHMVSDINISKSSAWLYMSWSSLYPLCTVEDECYILLTKVNFVLVRYTRMQPWLIISSAVGDAVPSAGLSRSVFDTTWKSIAIYELTFNITIISFSTISLNGSIYKSTDMFRKICPISRVWLEEKYHRRFEQNPSHNTKLVLYGLRYRILYIHGRYTIIRFPLHRLDIDTSKASDFLKSTVIG